MPRNTKYKFIDVQFNSFCHYWFLHLSFEQMKHLTPEEVRKLTVGKRLRKWVTAASLDEKLMLLAKTGCDFQVKLGGKEAFKNIESMKKDRDDVIEAMLKSKVFVLSSAKMLQTSFYLSQHSQSDFYMLNRNFQKIYELWKLAGKNLGKWRTEDDLRKIEFGFDMLLEVVYKNFRFKSIHAELGLTNEIDIVILLYLMRKCKSVDNRNNYVERTQIFSDCSDGTKKQTSFSQRLNWLYTNRYVIKDGTRYRYAIHDKGIMIVGDYLKRIAEYVRFDI